MIPTLQLGQLGLRRNSNTGTGWTPASLTVPPAWWVNETSSVTGATNASQWNDIAGGGYHVVQAAGGAQPTINASGLDGKRTLSADGGDLMNNAAAGAQALSQNKAAMWFMAVNKNNDASASQRTLFFCSTNSSSAARFNACTSTTSGQRRPALRVRRLDADAVTVLQSSGALDTNPHVLLFTMDWANGDGTIYIDGAQDAQNLALTTSGNTSNTAANSPIVLFGETVGNSISESGEMFFGVGSLPSAGEIDKLFGYLHHKWGLESLLPALHPYKTSPP